MAAKTKAQLEEISEEERIQGLILDHLSDLAGKRVGTDRIKRLGTGYTLPESTTLAEDIKFLVNYAESQETETAFTRMFRYRPWDGAAAFQSALMRVWGTAGIGQATYSFFGKEPPQMRTIDVGPHHQLQVPWGNVRFEPLAATITLGAIQDRDFGMLFTMTVTAPKKYASQVEGLFVLVENELRENSIYKGKAFTGAEEPSFLDPYAVDARKVVYSDEVQSQLDANIWSMLRHTDTIRKLGLPLKRSVLLGGPYGCGKSLGAAITAQIATENGWTFIQCRPDDDLGQTLQTARLYQPAVVFYEDIDNLTRQGDPAAISKLLDMFDGISIKGTELAMVLTTNKVERIHKGMLRPGRLDALINIGALDHDGFIKLVKVSVPEGKLDPDLDFDAIAVAMEGFLPAFVKEAIDRAIRYSVSRVGGEADVYTTEDFIHSATGLRPQLDQMNEAMDTISPEPLSAALSREVVGAMTGGKVAVYDRDDQHRFTLKEPNEVH